MEIKRINLVMALSLCLLIVKCAGQSMNSHTANVSAKDSSVYNKLLQMDFDKYISTESVGQFLNDVGSEYKDSTLGFAPTSYLRYITFSYSDKLWVELQVNDFKYMSSWNPKHKWDIGKFMKEKIGAIRFKYNGECVKCIEENQNSIDGKFQNNERKNSQQSVSYKPNFPYRAFPKSILNENTPLDTTFSYRILEHPIYGSLPSNIFGKNTKGTGEFYVIIDTNKHITDIKPIDFEFYRNRTLVYQYKEGSNIEMDAALKKYLLMFMQDKPFIQNNPVTQQEHPTYCFIGFYKT
jgi:hypothetical protein